MLPESFEKSLQNYDSELALRWGPYMREWVIERKAQRNISPGVLRLGKRCADKLNNYTPSQLGLDFNQHNQVVKYAEEFLSGKNGYRVVFFVKGLDNTVISQLWHMDLQRHGLRKFTADEERRDYLKQRRQDAAIEDAARETADAIQFVNKRNPVNATEVNKLLAQTGDIHPRAKTPKAILDVTGSPAKQTGEGAADKSRALLGMDGKPIRQVVPAHSEFEKKLIDAGAVN